MAVDLGILGTLTYSNFLTSQSVSKSTVNQVRDPAPFSVVEQCQTVNRQHAARCESDPTHPVLSGSGSVRWPTPQELRRFWCSVAQSRI